MKRSSKPWFLLISIYTTQYRCGIHYFSSIRNFTAKRNCTDKLALLNLIAIPLGKVLYAPFVDSFRLFFQGQYRSWLIFAQLSMVVLLLICGVFDIQQQFSTILILFIVYTLFMSLQDVSIDGLACKIFKESERQFANSIQYASNLLGNIIGGGLLLILYPWLEWQGTLWALAGLTAITCIQLLFL